MLKRKEVMMNDGIYRVINEGTSLMGNQYLNEAMFRAWLDYSIKMLNLVCSNTFVRYQYSSYALQRINSNDTPYGKLSKCVGWLIKAIPMM